MFFKRIFVVSAAQIGFSNANLTVHCVRDSNQEVIIGGLTEYSTCLECTCSVFELQCVEQYLKTNLNTLRSRSYTESQECKNCVCNSDSAAWAYNLNEKNEQMYPMTPKIPVPRPNVIATASRQSTTPNYAKDLLSYIGIGMQPESDAQNSYVFHEDNARFISQPIEFYVDINRASPARCTGNVSCDLHYRSNWDYRLRAQAQCNSQEAEDMCFGTQACICDNGYYKVGSSMSDALQAYRNYEGNKEIMLKFIQAKAA